MSFLLKGGSLSDIIIQLGTTNTGIVEWNLLVRELLLLFNERNGYLLSLVEVNPFLHVLVRNFVGHGTPRKLTV
jgi:hypothetical protein